MSSPTISCQVPTCNALWSWEVIHIRKSGAIGDTENFCNAHHSAKYRGLTTSRKGSVKSQAPSVRKQNEINKSRIDLAVGKVRRVVRTALSYGGHGGRCAFLQGRKCTCGWAIEHKFLLAYLDSKDHDDLMELV